MKRNTFLKSSMVTMFFFAASAYAVAQAGTAEVAAGGGFASYHYDGSSTSKGKFDASASFNALSFVSFGFEYGYSPIASATVSGGGDNSSASASLQTYGGVVRFGLLHEVKVQPYVLFAGGGSRASVSESDTEGDETTSVTASESGGYFGFGGGVNARIGGGFGVRPEVRYQRLSINSENLNEIDFTGSLFYTFGESHKKKKK